ncbi:ABC transporter permease [Micrococcales bacterium 31B]|nr:ABC transporter permease [Micrococcales bacterium 31B]
MWKRFLTSPKVLIGLVILGIFAIMAIFGPWFTDSVIGWGPMEFDTEHMGAGPSAAHWLGTTSSGQDVFSWLLYGARQSMLVGIGSALVGTLLAVIMGTAAGFIGGAVDRFINGVILVVQNMPSFAVLFIVAGLLQNANWIMVSLIIGLLEWSGGARLIRAQAMSLSGRDFTAALHTIGESRWRIVFVEVVPHLLGVLSPMFLTLIGAGVVQQSAIAFLGIGNASEPSWGLMMNYADSQNALFNGQWWWIVPPGICLALIGFSTTMVNFGLDEITNPALSSKRMRLMRIFMHKRALQLKNEGQKVSA